MSLLEQPRAVEPFAVHELVKIIEVNAHEGPVYVAGEDALYFTALPDESGLVAIRRLALDGLRAIEVTTVSIDANGANGMAKGHDGRLVVCEQGGLSAPARITRVDPHTGAVEVVVAELAGLPLNSPNDVVVKRDGTIWFTDPSYGYLQGFRPAPAHGDYVYCFDPATARLSVVAADFDKPNGLAFSPDETVLYIGDSGANHKVGSFDPSRPHHVRAFDVVANRLRGDRLFAVTTPGFPDGLKVDENGRIYASAASGVQVFDPAGDQIGEIPLPGAVNFTFGGRDATCLFITTDTAVWAAVLDTKGM